MLNGENTARAGFDEGALFDFTVTDVAEDFGIDGRLGVDEDAAGPSSTPRRSPTWRSCGPCPTPGTTR